MSESVNPSTPAKPQTRLTELLSMLYSKEVASTTASRLASIVESLDTAQRLSPGSTAESKRSEANGAMLITYADLIHSQNSGPLAALTDFLDTHVGDAFQRIHLLPFFPSSSDDGFAVIDYKRVDHHVGDWQKVNVLAQRYDLMFDLVINHCSREHLWFADFVNGKTPGKEYFITLPEESDTTSVTRPRSSPLISDVQTYAGIRHVWTTFSADQIDLDFSNPDVLVEMISILFFYIERGGNLIRLDAVAFLWKRLGTSCMSLSETHTVVQILRLLVDWLEDLADQKTILITETNVPHEENVSYFGDGNEAHGVYQFSLAPLMLYSYIFGNSTALTRWATDLKPPPEGCFALNFIASHDGIGLRPLEGLVSDAEVDKLVEKMHQRGGFSSLRNVGADQQRPYEINISLFSAFGGSAENLPAYLGAHALLMAFQGLPGLYMHSLLGSHNDLAKVEETGRTRSINRGTLVLEELNTELDNKESIRSRTLRFITRALRRRAKQPAFALSATQNMLDISPSLIAFQRCGPNQSLLVIGSVVDSRQTIAAADLGLTPSTYHCELHEQSIDIDPMLCLEGYQVLWLNTTGR